MLAQSSAGCLFVSLRAIIWVLSILRGDHAISADIPKLSLVGLECRAVEFCLVFLVKGLVCRPRQQVCLFLARPSNNRFEVPVDHCLTDLLSKRAKHFHFVISALLSLDQWRLRRQQWSTIAKFLALIVVKRSIAVDRLVILLVSWTISCWKWGFCARQTFLSEGRIRAGVRRGFAALLGRGLSLVCSWCYELEPRISACLRFRRNCSPPASNMQSY